jgi:hypothetical protein
LLTALASFLLGQDANWDLRNYHLYNGWAALHGRLSIDLAPAQLQSYFVPWLDAAYYLLVVKGSPMLAGTVLGAWHGLAFATIAAVAWLTLEGDPRRTWLAPLLGLAGCCSAVFLAELGNTMGDNTTAPFVIGALALTLRAARTDAACDWLQAGLLLGLALGLKLTNAPYALGLGLAALTTHGKWARRWRGAVLMTLAAIAMFALMAGPWFWLVNKQFGNPLFPQFNQWFHSPLAWPAPNNDASWLPKNMGQALTLPLLIAVKPGCIGEAYLYQPVWGILYLLAVLAIVKAALYRAGYRWRGLPVPNQSAARMLAVFVAVSFVMWMTMFSIHRYLTVLELVAPLALWLLIRHTLPAASAEKWAACLVMACAAAGGLGVVMMIKHNFWGHEGWTRPGFAVQAPHMEQPETATVLMVGGEPQAWRIPFLPHRAAYVGVAGFFPNSPGYDARVRQITTNRGGWVYALFPGAQEGAPCRCVLNPYVNQTSGQNRALIAEYETELPKYGWQLKPDTCTVHASYIGKSNYPYHWCQIVPLH